MSKVNPEQRPDPQAATEVSIKESECVEARLIEGLESGDPVLLDDAEWIRIRAEVKRLLDRPTS